MVRHRLLVDSARSAALRGVAPRDITIFRGSREDALDSMERAADDLERVSIVATINVDHVVELASNPAFADFYARADVVVVDGSPIVALARMLGASRISRVTGSDLFPAAVERVAGTGRRVAIVGGRDGVREAAVSALRSQHPDVDLVGLAFPMIESPDDERSREVIAELRRLRPSFVFLSLGSPKQELWLGRWADELPPAVYTGVGAAVDFAAGAARRAPTWIQAVGAEWLWRLAGEPRRLARRYLGRGPRFLAFAARSLLVRR